MRTLRLVETAVLAAALSWAGPAPAQATAEGTAGPPRMLPPSAAPGPTASAPATDRGPVSLLLHLGSFSGFGAGVALGTPDVGLRASVGWAPLLLVSSGPSNDLQLHGGLLVSPDLYARLFSPRPTSQVGLQAGYRYSSLLGHGLGLGGYAQFVIGGRVDALLSTGLMIFPDGEDRLRSDRRVGPNASFSFPGPSVNLGVSLGLVLSP